MSAFVAWLVRVCPVLGRDFLKIKTTLKLVFTTAKLSDRRWTSGGRKGHQSSPALPLATAAATATAMAAVEQHVTPGKTDPFGTGKILVTDCLDKFSQEQQDPFLMLHHFGPAHITAMPQFGMHPHRGFNECPYLKQGRWLATDPWNMEAEGEDAVMAEGQLQWGKCGGGIEHGMKFDPTYDGPVNGFQLWINLKTENKMDPPEFQNARADALPLLEVAPKVKAKLLVGELHGKSSPVESQGIHCQYVDYMVEAGGEATHPRSNGMSTFFVYVYDGSGSFGSSGEVAKAGEVLRLAATGDVSFRADRGSALGFVVLAGAPLKQPIVSHGPFVMSTRAQIMQAFDDYQRGRFLAQECTYKLHTKDGTKVSKRGIEDAYRRGRM
jgi:redox-sensitive bicupin YhaK (pirin superfamily)